MFNRDRLIKQEINKVYALKEVLVEGKNGKVYTRKLSEVKILFEKLDVQKSG